MCIRDSGYAAKRLIGRGRSNRQVWEMIHIMRAVQDRGDLDENLSVEFLPHGYELLDEWEREERIRNPPAYTIIEPIVPGQAARRNAKNRTNRSALSGTGRHSVRAATPRLALTHAPGVPSPSVILPPLETTRRSAARSSRRN